MKSSIRLKSDAFNEEIQALIDAGKRDMKMRGIKKLYENDTLVRRCLVLYCQAHFGDYDKDGRYEQMYEKLRNSMSLSQTYNEL